MCTQHDGSLTVKVSLESGDGNTSYASTSFADISGDWRRHEATLMVSPEVRCINRAQLSTEERGYWLPSSRPRYCGVALCSCSIISSVLFATICCKIKCTAQTLRCTPLRLWAVQTKQPNNPT